jgi:hypothetical protein
MLGAHPESCGDKGSARATMLSPHTSQAGPAADDIRWAGPPCAEPGGDADARSLHPELWQQIWRVTPAPSLHRTEKAGCWKKTGRQLYQKRSCSCCLPGILGPEIANLMPLQSPTAAMLDGGCIAGMSLGWTLASLGQHTPSCCLVDARTFIQRRHIGPP